jgi:hypothetical protein
MPKGVNLKKKMQKKTTQKTSIVLMQNGQPKIQADNVNELVKALYKGLRLQKQVGKRFLKLGATTQVVIPTKNTKYLQLQKLNAKGFDEAQMLAVVEFLNS